MIDTSELELLERIATTLERIEVVLEEKESRTLEIKETRQLMQNICKHYKETKPQYDIQIGSRLQIFRLRNAISQIKNIRNTKLENRKINKWIRRLEDHEFMSRTKDVNFEVLDTGKDWSELQ